MPIYDYQCNSCGCKKEVMRKISEPNLTTCQECGKQTFAKQLSAPSFQLSGSGWYATDFKNAGAKKVEAKPQSNTLGNNAPESNTPEKKTESTEASTPAAPTAPCNPGCACH